MYKKHMRFSLAYAFVQIKMKMEDKMFKYNIMITVTLALLISGCAELEVSPGKHSNLKNAPINEHSRAGIVSYSKDAIDEDDERQEAYDTMAESCHGAYKILKEELKRGNGDYLGDKELIIGTNEARVYISFECVNHH
jgi:hypothetical protein